MKGQWSTYRNLPESEMLLAQRYVLLKWIVMNIINLFTGIIIVRTLLPSLLLRPRLLQAYSNHQHVPNLVCQQILAKNWTMIFLTICKTSENMRKRSEESNFWHMYF
jgi:hypothetical protein